MMGEASKEQEELMKEWHDRTGFEFMGIDEAEAKDPQAFIGLWDKNVEWLRNVVQEVDAVLNQYRLRNIR